MHTDVLLTTDRSPLQILLAIQRVVNALGMESPSTYPLILPILQQCTDPNQVRVRPHHKAYRWSICCRHQPLQAIHGGPRSPGIHIDVCRKMSSICWRTGCSCGWWPSGTRLRLIRSCLGYFQTWSRRRSGPQVSLRLPSNALPLLNHPLLQSQGQGVIHGSRPP